MKWNQKADIAYDNEIIRQYSIIINKSIHLYIFYLTLISFLTFEIYFDN